MKKLILLGILVMSSLYSISQNGYPKEIILKSDTVVAITYPQLKEINSELEASKNKDSLILSLEKQNYEFEQLVNIGQNLIKNYKEQIEEYKIQLSLNESVISSLEIQNKKLQKQSKNNKIWGIVGGFITGSLITGLTVGLLSK